MESYRDMQEAATECVVDDKEQTIRRLTSDLERCHHESVKLVGILLDVAACVGCKRDSNYSTIKELKLWATGQVKVRKVESMQQTKSQPGEM